MIYRAPVRKGLGAATVLLCIVGCAMSGNSPQMLPVRAQSVASKVSNTAQSYAITDLGTLPGDGASEVGFGFIGGALNNSGQVAGASESGAWRAAQFSNGTVTNLNTLGPDVSVSQAMSISSSGQVAGWFYSLSNPNWFNFQAFLYSSGRMTDINDRKLFPGGSKAWGVNNSGQVVGQGYVDGSNFHAFLYSGGRMIDLTPGSNASGVAFSINDSGQIVGEGSQPSGYGPFIYANGKFTNIGCLSPRFINNNGQIVGIGNAGHATLYSNGVCTDLGNFPGAVSSVAMGINLAGQIVGTAVFPVTCYCHPPKPAKHVAFIVNNATLVDLNTLIPANSGFTMTDAVAINESGQIVGNAITAAGPKHAVLLKPR